MNLEFWVFAFLEWLVCGLIYAFFTGSFSSGSKSSEANNRELGAYAKRKGDIALDAKMYEEALPNYDQVIKCGVDAYYDRGLCHEALGWNRDAIDDFNEAIARNPADPNYFL